MALIRRAQKQDIDLCEQIYHELLDHEEASGSFTSWKKGIYPTRSTALDAYKEGTLFIGTEDEAAFGCVILNQVQAQEYEKIEWEFICPPEEIMVIHTLCIRPSFFGRGKGQEFLAFSEEYARTNGWSVIRLDTHEKNLPASKLYQKFGYRFAGNSEFYCHNSYVQTLICFEKQL